MEAQSNMLPVNNRFLNRTNPEMKRAVTDGGTIYSNIEIQKLARQQVDLSLWANLKFWVHRDLSKARISGSDTFVPSIYDISGQEYDCIQATTTKQPKLNSLGLDFPVSSINQLVNGDDSFMKNISNSDFTIMFWIKTSDIREYPVIFSYASGGGGAYTNWGVYLNVGAVNKVTYYASNGTSYFISALKTTTNINNGAWHQIIITRSGSTFTIYANNVSEGTASSSSSIANTNRNFIIGCNETAPPNNTTSFNGLINDIRIYNKALDATERTAIYNTTKSYYGL